MLRSVMMRRPKDEINLSNSNITKQDQLNLSLDLCEDKDRLRIKVLRPKS